MTKTVTDARLAELIQKKMPPALHPLGHEGDCMSCDLVFALRELQERRIEVEKYKAWAASCDEPAAPLVLGERAEAVKLLRASWAACIDGEPDKALADNIHEFLERLAANR